MKSIKQIAAVAVLAALVSPGFAAEPTPTEIAKSYTGPETGKFLFKLSFVSADSKALTCASSVFAARGDAGLAEAMLAPTLGKKQEASFSTITPSLPEGTDQLVESLSKCQLDASSTLTWSVGRTAT